MPKLTIQEKGKARLYEIHEESVYVGRSQECHVRLRDPNTAGIHCQIKRIREGYKLVDLESKVGTKVNGRFVNQHRLEDGDRIQVGSTLIRYEQEEHFAYEGSATRRRLEREAGPLSNIPPWGVGVLVASVALLIVVVFVVILSPSPPAGWQQMEDAERLFTQGLYDEALKVLEEARAKEEIDPVIENEFQRIEREIAGMKKSEVEIAIENDYLDTAQEVIRFANLDENRKRLVNKDKVLARFDQWFKQNPEAPERVKTEMEDRRQKILQHYATLEKNKRKRDNW